MLLLGSTSEKCALCREITCQLSSSLICTRCWWCTRCCRGLGYRARASRWWASTFTRSRRRATSLALLNMGSHASTETPQSVARKNTVRGIKYVLTADAQTAESKDAATDDALDHRTRRRGVVAHARRAAQQAGRVAQRDHRGTTSCVSWPSSPRACYLSHLTFAPNLRRVGLSKRPRLRIIQYLSVAQCRAPGFDQETRAQYPSLTMHYSYLGRRAMDSLQRWKHQAMSLVFLPKLLLQRVARQVAQRRANAHSRSGDVASQGQGGAGHARTSTPLLTKVPPEEAPEKKLCLNVCVTTVTLQKSRCFVLS